MSMPGTIVHNSTATTAKALRSAASTPTSDLSRRQHVQGTGQDLDAQLGRARLRPFPVDLVGGRLREAQGEGAPAARLDPRAAVMRPPPQPLHQPQAPQG